MVLGKVLRMYDSRAVFENMDTGNCLVATQMKDGRDMKICERAHLPEIGGPCAVMPIEAIFGIYDLLSGSYVAVVVESEPFVSVEEPKCSINIRKAKKIILVPLFRNGRLLSEVKQRDEDRYLQLLHLSFSNHQFFFSATFDVTLSQQCVAKLTSRQLANPIWARADDRFFWNHNVILDLIACEAEQWIVPFMSAYIEVRLGCEIEENAKFTLLLISRRSRYRQGCRFTKRGLDEHGNVANFVETEQILLFPDGRVTSLVQIRGSIPVHWASPVHMKYDPVVQINDDRDCSAEWAEKHVSQVLAQYCAPSNVEQAAPKDGLNLNSGAAYSTPSTAPLGSVVFINLVDNKKDQGKLGAVFKETVDLVQKRTKHPLHFVWFDFHAECKKKGKWNNLSKLVLQIDEIFRSQKFFCKLPSGIVTSWQCGVLRTNCMDNLDRTNVVQSLFARRSLIIQLGKGQILDKQPDSSLNYVLDSPWKKFESGYKAVWVKNADAMSNMYAGTGALKVDFTLTGKRTITGMYNDGVNSCMRYYLNNFTDGMKQDSIDLLLGNYRPDPNGTISPFTPRADQESLSDNFLKLFVLLVAIFSAFLLIAPLVHESLFDTSYEPAAELPKHLLISIGITAIVFVITSYIVLKQGSTLGLRSVVHPQLVIEPLPNAPADTGTQ